MFTAETCWEYNTDTSFTPLNTYLLLFFFRFFCSTACSVMSLLTFDKTSCLLDRPSWNSVRHCWRIHMMIALPTSKLSNAGERNQSRVERWEGIARTNRAESWNESVGAGGTATSPQTTPVVPRVTHFLPTCFETMYSPKQLTTEWYYSTATQADIF